MILTTGTPVRPFCGMVESLYKHQYLLLLLLLLLYYVLVVLFIQEIALIS